MLECACGLVVWYLPKVVMFRFMVLFIGRVQKSFLPTPLKKTFILTLHRPSGAVDKGFDLFGYLSNGNIFHLLSYGRFLVK